MYFLFFVSKNEFVITSNPLPALLFAATRVAPCADICQSASSNSDKLIFASSHFVGIEYALFWMSSNDIIAKNTEEVIAK
jgi:hypothetical protein